MWYVYFVLCNDGTLYCGATNNVEKRVNTHNSGKGAKYTSTRRPVKLVYVEEFPCKIDALKREWFIKHKLSRKDKDALIKEYNEHSK